jgi:Flp pilus assembly protein TadB
MIPVLLTIALWFISPEYIKSFFDRGPFCGWLAVVTIVGMIVSGYFVMMKIADIEV